MDHRAISKTVTECYPVSSRLFAIRLEAIHMYDPTTRHSNEEGEEFYKQLQSLLVQEMTPLLWRLLERLVRKEAQQEWSRIYGPNQKSNESTKHPTNHQGAEAGRSQIARLYSKQETLLNGRLYHMNSNHPWGWHKEWSWLSDDDIQTTFRGVQKPYRIWI